MSRREKLLADPDAEENLLGCLIQNPRAITRVVDLLSADDFYRERHRIIYEIMVNLHKNGRRCSSENVWSEVVRLDKLEEMGDLVEADLFTWGSRLATLQPVLDHVWVVQHFAIMRRLRDAGSQIVALAYDEQEDAVEQAERLVYNVVMGAGTRPVATLAEALDRYVEELEQRIEERRNGVARGIPTGFSDLDHAIGGLQPGALYTLGALTGLGKTAWSLNVAMNVVQHARHALFFSLEMKESELVQRILSTETIIDQTLLRDAEITALQLEVIRQRAQGLRACDLKIDDHSYLLADLKSNIRQVHARKSLDLVVIDYLQLVKTNPDGRARHETRAEEIATLSREMKRLAHELDIPILVLAQLNRNVEHKQNKEPTLADINESGSIARDSDVVLFLYTTDEELAKASECQPYQVFLKIAKNRNGRIGGSTLEFHPRITKFRDAEVGIRAEEQEEGADEDED